MTKVIIISGSSLESFYEQTLQDLRAKYHTYPTLALPNLTANEKAAISYRDAMARHTARGAQISSNIPIGKLVA